MNPDNILSSMLRYGAILGTLAGALVMFVMGWVANAPLQVMITSAIAFGSLYGLLFGSLAGAISGSFMSELLPRYTGTQASIISLRVILALITTIVTTVVFSPLFLIADNLPIALQRENFLAGLIFSIGLSVYACQRVITKYLRETDLRKAKG
mgnify:CR=1 FL=1